MDARLEDDVWHALPKLLSVPDVDAADDDAIRLASEFDGKIARRTSLVRRFQRTSAGRQQMNDGVKNATWG